MHNVRHLNLRYGAAGAVLAAAAYLLLTGLAVIGIAGWVLKAEVLPTDLLWAL